MTPDLQTLIDQATPLPWMCDPELHVSEWGQPTSVVSRLGKNGPEEVVALVTNPFQPDATVLANAELITRAVNTLPALVSALSEIINLVDQGEGASAIYTATAALKLARGEE